MTRTNEADSGTKAGTNYLTEAEERKLFSLLKNRKDKQAERDYVLLSLTRKTGMRRGEVLSLNVGDIMDRQKIVIDERIARKGGLGEVYLSIDIQVLLKRFLKLKKKWGESVEFDAPLFISKKHGRLSLRSFNDLMDKWCALAGLDRFTPHALRHTKAQRIMEKAENPRKALLFAKKQLRHSTIAATMVYTEINKEEQARVGAI